MTRKLPHPAKVRICLLAVAVALQTFCAIHASASAENPPAALASGCHDETPAAPAAPAKCCVMQDMLKASLPARFSLPESPMVPAKAVNAATHLAATSLLRPLPVFVLNDCPPAFAILRV